MLGYARRGADARCEECHGEESRYDERACDGEVLDISTHEGPKRGNEGA